MTSGWSMSRSVPVSSRTEDGRVTRLLGVSWDVTREIEDAIRLAEQAAHERMLLDRLSMSTQAAGIASWEYDLVQQQFQWIENPIQALQDEHGGSELAPTLLERVHPEDREQTARLLEAALLQKQGRVSCRFRSIGASGNIVHVQTHARVLYDDVTGAARRLLGISWDITREITAAEQLQQQALKLRDAERRLERASLLSRKVTGRSTSDVAGLDVIQLPHAARLPGRRTAGSLRPVPCAHPPR